MREFAAIYAGVVLLTAFGVSISHSSEIQIGDLERDVRNKTCPANTARANLLSDTKVCASEYAAVNKNSASNSIYNDWQRCRSKVDKDNSIINRYNAFMVKCDNASASRNKSFTERSTRTVRPAVLPSSSTANQPAPAASGGSDAVLQCKANVARNWVWRRCFDLKTMGAIENCVHEDDRRHDNLMTACGR